MSSSDPTAAAEHAASTATRSAAARIQAKTAVGRTNDSYEQEADRVADAVVSHDATTASRAAATAPAAPGRAVPTISRLQRLQRKEEKKEPQAKLQRQEEEKEAPQAKLQRQEEEKEEPQAKLQRQEEEKEEPQAKLQRQEEEKEEPQAKLQRQGEKEEPKAKLQRQEEKEEPQAKLQRQEEKEPQAKLQQKAASTSASGKTQASARLESNLRSTRGGGSSLPDNVRAEMEPSIGADFSNVRVHTGAAAVQMNQELNAQAFTHGPNIYFNEGKYDSGSRQGKKLLAHELTHTVQQGASPRTKPAAGSNAGPSVQRFFGRTASSIGGAASGAVSAGPGAGEPARRAEARAFTVGRGIVQRKPNAATQGETTRKKAKQWLAVDDKIKVEVDVLKAAIREIKRGKSVGYNQKTGAGRIDNVAALLGMKPSEVQSLKRRWDWLADNRKSKAGSGYKKNEKRFFAALESPLKSLKKKYPGQQTHYWLKNSPAQILDLIYKVADATLPAPQLWAYASKEGLVDYARGQIGLAATSDPTEAQLKSVSVTEKISGFAYLGMDDYVAALADKKKPLMMFLPKGYDVTKVKEIHRVNEKGRIVKSGEFPNMLMAVQAFSAMLKRRRALFKEDAAAYGYKAPTDDELVYWTYVYFNAGEFGGKNQLKKYQGTRKLSTWIQKGEYPNAIKLLQSYRMVSAMKLF